MRLKSIDLISSGEVLAKPVYDDKCQLLLGKGVELSDSYIGRLKLSKIQCVYIEDDLSEGLEAENLISNELKIRSIGTVKEVFKSLSERKSSTYTVKMADTLKHLVDEMIEVVYANPKTLYCMTELMGTDMYTYHHSVEVAILSMLVAKSLGMNDAFVHKIGVGAILHDLGKMQIPGEILNKIGVLSDEEMALIRQHPQLGYDMLKENDSISPISRQIVLLHHEKLNGSGYPFGFSADDIGIHIRVVTLCDIFNAITSNRSYKQKLNADEALEVLRAETVYELDREIYYHLLRVVNIYPAGTIVELSDRRIGIVIKENKEVQTRPIVQVIRDKKRQEVVNLMDHLTLFVSRTIDF